VKTWLLVAAVVATTVAGDALQTLGMRRHGEVEINPGALGRFLGVFRNNWPVILSIVMMAASFFAFLTLLSVADLSFAVPATAASIVIDTVVARYLLREKVDWRRWAGAGLVACGVALLAL
jgi:multidrug transporter EmrE-like cation transporter